MLVAKIIIIFFLVKDDTLIVCGLYLRTLYLAFLLWLSYVLNRNQTSQNQSIYTHIKYIKIHMKKCDLFLERSF